MANCYENIVYTSRVFTPKQFTTLLALADTYYPSLTPTEVDNLLKNHIANTIIDPKTETIEKWLRQASSECREFVETLDYFFYARIPGAAKAKVALVLDLLGYFLFIIFSFFSITGDASLG